jgi:ATPase family associated with various cellular activities (AAA)
LKASLFNSAARIVSLKAAIIDREFWLLEICRWAETINLSVYFWNLGYLKLQQVTVVDEKIKLESDRELDESIAIETIIPWLCDLNREGIFILEGLLDKLDRFESLQFHLRNAYFSLQSQNDTKYLVFSDDRPEIPINLQPLLPMAEYGSPTMPEIKVLVEKLLGEASSELIQACVGLARKEIEQLLCDRAEEAIEGILAYKKQKLALRGLTVLPEPDVPDVGGLDLLEKDLDKIKKLFSPEAIALGLRPPKGGLMWGLPGTGKSLIAKMMAKKIGATLVFCDWNQLIGATLSESLANLQYVLDLVDNLGSAILFFDEFEKAFAGWDSGVSGGVLAKMAGKLLSWMQDHQSPVMMLTSCSSSYLKEDLASHYFSNTNVLAQVSANAVTSITSVPDMKVKELWSERQEKLLFIDFNSEKLCGKLGCAYNLFLSKNDELNLVWSGYLDPYLPPQVKLLAVKPVDEKRQQYPCLLVNQLDSVQSVNSPTSPVIKEVTLCKSGEKYQIESTRFFRL